MRKLRQYERVQLRCGCGAGALARLSGANLRSDVGTAGFGKGMASAMPKQQPTSTALAAEASKKIRDVL